MLSKNLPVAAYLRLSTREQTKDPNALESHLFRVRRAISDIGGDFDERFIFTDIMSGRRSDRPNFLKLKSLIESKSISAVVVRLDRLSRDGGMFHELSRLFERTGVKLYDLNKGRFIDFSNPEDWGEYQSTGINAEKESRVISRRIRDRNEFTRHQGKIQSGNPPFGYRRSTEGFYEPRPEQWALARSAIALFLSSFSTSAAVRALKELGVEFTPQGLAGWLKNEVLRGNTPYLITNKKTAGDRVPSQIKRNTHTPLLAEDEAQTIDRALSQKRTRRDRRPDLLIPLSGFVWCDRCPSHCIFIGWQRHGIRHRTAYCAAHRKNSGCGGAIEGHGKTAGKMGKLGTPYHLIESAVIQALCDRAVEISLSESVGKADAIEVDTPEAIALKQAIHRYEILAVDDPDLLGVLNKKRNDLALLRSPDAVNESLEYSREKLASLASLPIFWESASLSYRLILYREFVDRIFVNGRNIRVILRV